MARAAKAALYTKDILYALEGTKPPPHELVREAMASCPTAHDRFIKDKLMPRQFLDLQLQDHL
jgi:hypothetical protein